MNSHCLKLHWSFSISFIQFAQWWGHFLGKENFCVVFRYSLIKAGACMKLGSFMSQLTRDQAQFSFRFVNNIPAGKAKRKRTWHKPSTKRLPPTFSIDWHLLNQPTKITPVACFFSVHIFHTWENCTLADLKNSFYLLTF